jgi:pantetheine-phosphate adenylyltransferase
MSPARLAICAGSFDPLTNGHLDMIVRGARLFDRLVVAVLVNPSKQPMFSAEERVDLIRQVIGTVPNVEVDTFSGLLTEFARRRGAAAIIRGLRTATEYDDEWPMAMMNRHLAPDIETVFLLPSRDAAFISSRLVKEIAVLGGSLDGLVPPVVAAALSRRHGPQGTIRV